MKRILYIPYLIVFVISFSLTVFSVNIDGIDNGAEWNDSVVIKLVEGESNCNVNFGLLKAKLENENSAVFLSFMFMDPTLEMDNTNAGVSLSIEGSDPFVLTMNSSPVEYDVDKFSFSGVMTFDENNGATCEIRIGVKYGLDDCINGTVRFIDSSGAPSNFYDFSIDNNSYIAPTTKYIYKDSYYIVAETTGTSRTTTEKNSTIKETVNKEITKEPTDDENSDFGFNLGLIFDLFIPTETETKASVSTPSTTKLITEVYKTAIETFKNTTKKTTVATELSKVETTTSLSEDTIVYESKEDVMCSEEIIPISKGSKYKIITGVVCGVSLLVIAMLGTYKFKNINDDENDPKP